MRGFSVVALMLAISPVLLADSLTQADREALLEKLAKIQAAEDAKTDARFAVAVAAFKNALSSDQAALDLYLKCIEKKQVEEEHKKSQEFREWKRKEEDKLNNVGFHHALRHQLRWLLLTLQVASSQKDVTAFGPDAMRLVDDVFADADSLADQRNFLRQGVLSSVFAQTYDLGSVKVDGWPGSPLELNQIFDKVVMPPLRNTEKIESLRAAWGKRIQDEVIIAEKWSKDPATPDKFRENEYPDLLWQMEIDVYKAGDQRGAALRMFQHLEKYGASTKASEWSKQFKELLDPRPEGAAPTVSPGTGKAKPAPSAAR